jgi:hypothetical protein
LYYPERAYWSQGYNETLKTLRYGLVLMEEQQMINKHPSIESVNSLPTDAVGANGTISIGATSASLRSPSKNPADLFFKAQAVRGLIIALSYIGEGEGRYRRTWDNDQRVWSGGAETDEFHLRSGRDTPVLLPENLITKKLKIGAVSDIMATIRDPDALDYVAMMLCVGCIFDCASNRTTASIDRGEASGKQIGQVEETFKTWISSPVWVSTYLTLDRWSAESGAPSPARLEHREAMATLTRKCIAIDRVSAMCAELTPAPSILKNRTFEPAGSSTSALRNPDARSLEEMYDRLSDRDPMDTMVYGHMRSVLMTIATKKPTVTVPDATYPAMRIFVDEWTYPFWGLDLKRSRPAGQRRWVNEIVDSIGEERQINRQPSLESDTLNTNAMTQQKGFPWYESPLDKPGVHHSWHTWPTTNYKGSPYDYPGVPPNFWSWGTQSGGRRNSWVQSAAVIGASFALTLFGSVCSIHT